jgi:hypothetical protein
VIPTPHPLRVARVRAHCHRAVQQDNGGLIGSVAEMNRWARLRLGARSKIAKNPPARL